LKPPPADAGGVLAMQALHNIWFSAGRHRLTDLADAAGSALLEEARRALAEHETQTDTLPPTPSLAPLADDDIARQVWPFVLQNFASMVWTDNVILPLLDSTPGIRLYAEAPRITIFSTGPVGADRVATSMDFRRDDLRGLAIDSSKGALLADKKLQFSALQAALEHETIAELTTMATGAASGVRSTSSMLAGKRLATFVRNDQLPPADRDTAVEIAAALDAGRLVVAPAADGQIADAWWEVLPDTGDTRAIAEGGLRGAGTPPINPKDLFVIKHKIQQNPWGGQNTIDLRPKKEIFQESYDARMARLQKAATEKAAEFNKNKLAQPQQAPARGGGSEYGVLVAAISVVGKIALNVLSYYLVLKLFEQVELVVSWLADGGFSAAWP
jgi:hypothetical protein